MRPPPNSSAFHGGHLQQEQEPPNDADIPLPDFSEFDENDAAEAALESVQTNGHARSIHDPTSLLDLGDGPFIEAWFLLSDEAQAALPLAVRTEAAARFHKLTTPEPDRRPLRTARVREERQEYPDITERHIEPTLAPAEAPDPVDLTRAVYHGAALPLAYIPACLKPLLRDFQARTGIAAGPAFLGYLGALSTFANDFIRLQPKQLDHTWAVRPTIWFFAVGGSSSGKTPALEAGMAIVQRKDTAAVVENARRRKDHEHALKIYEDDCAAARKAKMPRPEEPPAPTLREFWVQRGTTEGVTRVLESSPKVVWYMGEGSGLINSWDRYAPGGKGSGDREFVLMLWDGGPGKNTLAGKTVSLNNASAVLGGGSTPAAMLSSCAGKLQTDGFLQRTLLCMVPDQVKGADTAPDSAALALYGRTIDGLQDMPPCTLLLSAEAQQIYNDFCDELRALIIAERGNEALAAHLGKWYGLAPRLMLLYCLTDLASHGQMPADGQRIPGDIARQVCALLMEWQLTHLRQFWHELMSEKIGRKFAQTIAKYILANPDIERLNFRNHISNPHWTAFDKLKPWEIKEAVNTLISAAWITPEEGRTNSYGVAANFRVNPKVATMFEAEREDELARRADKREQLEAQRALDSNA